MRLGLGTLLVSIITAAALLAAPLASAGPYTTEPGVLYKVKVVITDKKITIAHKEYARGAIIQYRIRNKGKKTHALVIQGDIPIRSRNIKPGGRGILLLQYEARGRFEYYSPMRYDRKKPLMRGAITIF